MSSSEWDFADAVTVLGYFIITVWLLGALFQLSINLFRRSAASVVETEGLLG